MLLITDIAELPSINTHCGLTLGTFDGVHLGHQSLLNHLRKKLQATQPLVVFTFSNHPSHHFTPSHPTPLICPPLQKARLLGDYGADIVILVPFTATFACLSFDLFLRTLSQKLPISQLVLGIGATFGKNKEGNEERVRLIAPTLGCEVEYAPKLMLHGAPISSRRIRTLISQAAFSNIAQCLGRPYSLCGPLQDHVFQAEGLCLPPAGIYPVLLKIATQTYAIHARVAPEKHHIYIEPPQPIPPAQNTEVEIIFY